MLADPFTDPAFSAGLVRYGCRGCSVVQGRVVQPMPSIDPEPRPVSMRTYRVH
ncbi:MAG: hypothetical protein Ct9H300mP16_12340 [Pseudomonadota bacterium]|nr:MAG: hypothetical protein Ct9H300mP16_12340 [Pseudomonadota bacterium]